VSAFVSVKEYAAYRGVHPNTILAWIRRGKIPAEQPGGPRGRYAIPAEMLIPYRTDLPPLTLWPERKS
jgi:excisionase family DNA binding protein